MSGGWVGSDRAARLPANWAALRAEADRINPRRICHWCGRPPIVDRAEMELDHKVAGDDHRQGNLDWIHADPCHRDKSSAEGVAARRAMRYLPKRTHPALR